MPANTKISEIMAKTVFTVTLNDPVSRVEEIMKEENVRHVPVVDDDKFVGLITDRTLAEYKLRDLYEYEEEGPGYGDNIIGDFENIMERDVRIIYPEDSIKKAIEIMVKKKVDCLPVVDWENNILGILTYLDILLFVNNELV